VNFKKLKNGGNKMKKFSILLIFLLTFTLIFSSVGLTKEYITIAGGSVSGNWFPVASAIAELLNKELGEKICSAKPGGGISNPIIVSENKVSSGFSYSSYLVAAEQGVDPYEQKMGNLRSIARLFPMYFQIMGAAELPYDTLDDFIKNKYPLKFCPDAPGHGEFWIFQKIFGILGANFDDVAKWGGTLIFSGGGVDSRLAQPYRSPHAIEALTVSPMRAVPSRGTRN